MSVNHSIHMMIVIAYDKRRRMNKKYALKKKKCENQLKNS